MLAPSFNHSDTHHRRSLILQHFSIKPEPVKILKGLLCKPFKIFTVVRLIENCCESVRRCFAPPHAFWVLCPNKTGDSYNLNFILSPSDPKRYKYLFHLIRSFLAKNLPHPNPSLAKGREQDFWFSPFARGN